jgi:uncharacterized protein YecE (DUF72 family)
MSAVRQRRDKVNIGCCGFALAQARYLRTFDCVEINSSFYQLPRLQTAQRWRATAPAEFAFSLKAWQVITHTATSPTYKRTRIDPRDRPHCGNFGFNPTIRWAWDQTFHVATALQAVLVLFQCPASFRPTRENLARLRTFFERAKRGKFLMGWEPRGDWDLALIGKLCRDLDLVHVVDPFATEPAVRGKIRYYRLHGITGPRHRYSEAQLRQLAEFCREGLPTWCLFNNVAMAQDAVRFQHSLAGSR